MKVETKSPVAIVMLAGVAIDRIVSQLAVPIIDILVQALQ